MKDFRKLFYFSEFEFLLMFAVEKNVVIGYYEYSLVASGENQWILLFTLTPLNRSVDVLHYFYHRLMTIRESPCIRIDHRHNITFIYI